MRNLLIAIYFVLLSNLVVSQIPTPSCNEPVEACDSILLFPPWWRDVNNTPQSNYSYTPIITMPGFYLPFFYNVFPPSNPLSPNHAGCNTHYNNPVWIKITIESSGYLEYFFKPYPPNSTAPSQYFQPPGVLWSLFEYLPNSQTCDLIANNGISPIACNTGTFSPNANLVNFGFTGMLVNNNLLPYAIQDRIEPSIYVNSGEQFLILANVNTWLNNSQPIYFPRMYLGNAIPGNENSTTTATFTCEPWTIPKEVCLGDSIWFELGNAYNNYDSTYAYTFLNIASDVVDASAAPWFQVQPTDTTTYNIEVSKNGLVYDTLSATVNVSQTPTPNAGPDLFVCEGDTAFLSAQLSDTSNYFYWQIVDTNDYSSAYDSLYISYASLPDTDILILNENNGICPTAMDTVTITTQPTPILNLLNDTTTCINGSAEIEAIVNNAIADHYLWSFPSDSSALQNITPNSATWINCIAVDSIGCTSKPDSVHITFFDSLNINTTSNINYCEGETINLNSSVTGGLSPYSFNWINNGQIFSTSQSTNYSPTGQDQIFLQVNDACETPMDSVEINFTPYAMPNINPIVSDTLLCFPGEINLSFAQDPLIQNWSWQLGDGNTIQNQNPLTYAYNQNGIFNVSLSYQTIDNCLDTNTNIELEVIENPIADFTFNSDITEFSTQVLFNNNSRFADYSQWTFENAQPSTSTLEHPTTNFEEGEIGEYIIELLAFNNIGCTDTLLKTIRIAPEFSLFAPNAFTPNGDQSNNTWSVAINGIDTKDFHVQIFNRHGTLIFESYDYNFEWDGTYKGKRVPNGTYTWKIDLSTSQNAERLVKTGFVLVLY